MQAGDSAGETLTIRTGGTGSANNRMVISNSGITLNAPLTISGSSITGLTITASQISDPANLSITRSQVSDLASQALSSFAGNLPFTRVTGNIEYSRIANVPSFLTSRTPSEGLWNNNELRIGNGHSVLWAGNSANETLILSTEGNASSNRRMVLSSSGITLYEDLLLNGNSITGLNHRVVSDFKFEYTYYSL